MRIERRTAMAGLAVTVAAAGAALWIWPARRPRNTVTPQDFGAVGDGRADDTGAIRAAIASGATVLRFPAGTYKVTGPLHPVSGQSWIGEGPAQSVLAYGGAPRQAPFNVIHIRGAIEDFTVSNLGFRGGRVSQKAFAVDGQSGFAIYLRGVQRHITIRDCHFRLFGDGQDSGGGISLGPLPDDAEQDLVHIRVEGCQFSGNGNVPGVYVSGGGSDPHSVSIVGNRFTGTAGSRTIQNTVFVLGWGLDKLVRRVDVSNNQFDFATPVDAGIELNWVDGFTIANNVMGFRTALAKTSAVLLRDGCRNGTVTGNAFTGNVLETDLRGIVLLNFKHPATQGDIVIAGNTLSGIPRAIAIDRGSYGVVVNSNRISGGVTRGQVGIRVLDARDIMVRDNLVTDMERAVEIGASADFPDGLGNVEISANTFLRCGDAVVEVTEPGTTAQARIHDNLSAPLFAVEPPP